MSERVMTIADAQLMVAMLQEERQYTLSRGDPFNKVGLSDLYWKIVHLNAAIAQSLTTTTLAPGIWQEYVK